MHINTQNLLGIKSSNIDYSLNYNKKIHAPGILIIYNGVIGCGMQRMINDIGYKIPYKKESDNIEKINANIKKTIMMIEDNIKYNYESSLYNKDNIDMYNIIKIANPNLDPTNLEEILEIAVKYDYDVELYTPNNYLLYSKNLEHDQTNIELKDLGASKIIEQQKTLVSYNLKISENTIANDCQLSLKLTNFIKRYRNANANDAVRWRSSLRTFKIY
jgi:hypothetical protein